MKDVHTLPDDGSEKRRLRAHRHHHCLRPDCQIRETILLPRLELSHLNLMIRLQSDHHYSFHLRQKTALFISM